MIVNEGGGGGVIPNYSILTFSKNIVFTSVSFYLLHNLWLLPDWKLSENHFGGPGGSFLDESNLVTIIKLDIWPKMN